MNKTKKELYEENKKLKNTINTYSNFWETEAIEECTKQMKFTKKTIYFLIYYSNSIINNKCIFNRFRLVI